MSLPFDLDQLLRREDASVEWKRNVADVDDVVAKLVAIANDVTGTVPEGWVICGVEETQDEHGFQQARMVGLEADRFKRLKHRTLALCRQRVQPPLNPQVFELPVPGDPSRRILVFYVPRSERAHRFKHHKKGDEYWITADANTVPARDRLLRELLRRKDELPPFLERACPAAALDDVDRVAAEQFMKDAKLPQPPAEYLRPGVAIDIFARPLVLEATVAPGRTQPLPTYLSLLLFGREPTRFLPGAYVVLSVYEGTDRTAVHSRRFESAGPLPKLVRDVLGALRLHTGIAIDKSADALSSRQNRPRYSEKALQEAVVNAFAHRDYEAREPIRITVFSDHIEVHNPGGLEPGVDLRDLEAGRYYRWRNEALARFLLKMELAQSEGQGIPTIVEETLAVAGHKPEIRSLNGSFLVSLPAYMPPDFEGGLRLSASDLALAKRSPARVFLSYSQADGELRRVLGTHLAPLERQGVIATWHDRKILPGEEWEGEIDRHMEEADLVLLLVSPDFLASDYCYGEEMERALARHRAGEALVVPVILRPSDWQSSSFAHLAALPEKGRAISGWKDRDAALLAVAQGVRAAIAHLAKRRSEARDT